MDAKYADLHTHTKASDGMESPAANVRLAAAAGLAAVAVTDHDTVAGVEEALAEGKRLGIEVVPGVEISTLSGGQDIHVLGYFIRTDDPVFLERLERLRKTRDLRNELMLEKLRSLGVKITIEEVLETRMREHRPDETVGRPHIADVLMKKGYAASLEDAFAKYLGKQGAAYVNPPRISPEEAIQWIHEAGGAAVLAHPGLYKDDPLVETLISSGLDGIEAYHSDHSPEEGEKYRALAERHGLIVTAGSDFHGERNGKVFHAPLGSRKVDVKVIDQLRQALGARMDKNQE